MGKKRKIIEVAPDVAKHLPNAEWGRGTDQFGREQTVKLDDKFRAILAASGTKPGPFIIIKGPKPGRPFFIEPVGRITLKIIIPDGSKSIIIKGDKTLTQPTRQRHFVSLFTGLNTELEKDFSLEQFRYNVENKDGSNATPTNIQQVATRLRRFLLQCVPVSQHKLVKTSITTDKTSIIINLKSLAFKTNYTSTRLSTKPIGRNVDTKGDILDANQNADQKIDRNADQFDKPDESKKFEDMTYMEKLSCIMSTVSCLTEDEKDKFCDYAWKYLCR